MLKYYNFNNKKIEKLNASLFTCILEKYISFINVLISLMTSLMTLHCSLYANAIEEACIFRKQFYLHSI